MKYTFNGKPFTGVVTALVTPCTKDNTIDDEKLTNLVNLQIEKGVKGLLVLGGSGEYVAFSMEERVRAIKTAVKAAAGRIPIITGILEPGIGDAITAAKLLREAGADIPLVVTPYYVSPSQDGIYDFFKKFDEALDWPFLIYNIPYKTGTNITPATIERVARNIPNCAGVKECSPSFGAGLELIQRCSDLITIFSGEDLLMGGHVLFGAEAAIIASGNIIPEVWNQIFDLAMARKVDEVAAVQKAYFPFLNLLFREINPGPMKYAMNRAGIPVGDVTIPLQPCSEPLRAELDAEMKRLGLI